MRRRRLGARVLAAWLALAAPASAQDAAPTTPPVSTEREQALAAWDRAAEPGAWHDFLARRAGRWRVTGRIWNEPEGEPVTAVADARLEMALGGRFLQERLKGETGGLRYEGWGQLGIDNADSTATAVWCDDLGTRTSVLSGRAGHVGEPLQLRGTVTDPASGRRLLLRVVITWISADEHRWDYYGAPEGFDEAHLIELVYRRR